MPTLVQKYKNQVVEVRLKKFYTIYNEAIKRAELEYGDKKDWYLDSKYVQLDKDGNPIEGTSAIDNWFKKYLFSFIPIKKTVYQQGQVRYYLADGSAFQFGKDGSSVQTSRGLHFFPRNPDKCDISIAENLGVCSFYFLYDPQGKFDSRHKDKGLEPTMYSWDGRRNSLINGCKSRSKSGFCTTLIKYDGWQISKDYPHKVR